MLVLNQFQISSGETGRQYWALVEQNSGGESNEIMSFVICLMSSTDRKGSGRQATSCHTMPSSLRGIVSSEVTTRKSGQQTVKIIIHSS